MLESNPPFSGFKGREDENRPGSKKVAGSDPLYVPRTVGSTHLLERSSICNHTWLHDDQRHLSVLIRCYNQHCSLQSQCSSTYRRCAPSYEWVMVWPWAMDSLTTKVKFLRKCKGICQPPLRFGDRVPPVPSLVPLGSWPRKYLSILFSYVSDFRPFSFSLIFFILVFECHSAPLIFHSLL